MHLIHIARMKNYASLHFISLCFFFLFSPLALFSVSNIDIHYITPITCVCCIFYTCVGGIKAGKSRSEKNGFEGQRSIVEAVNIVEGERELRHRRVLVEQAACRSQFDPTTVRLSDHSKLLSFLIFSFHL
jgi:hypothetical protein